MLIHGILGSIQKIHMRIEPIGAIGSVDAVAPIISVQRVQHVNPAVLEERKKQAKQVALFKAVDAQVSNSHLATYLDLAGRKYNYYPEYGQYWLKERKSKRFNTVVSHIFTRNNHWMSIIALLIKHFTSEEKELLIPYISELNTSASDAYFIFGSQDFPDDMLASVYGFPSTDVSRLKMLNQHLEIPIDKYFKEENGIYNRLYNKAIEEKNEGEGT